MGGMATCNTLDQEATYGRDYQAWELENLTVWGLAGRPFGPDKQSDFRVPKPDSPPHVASYAVCTVNRICSVTARPFIHVVRDRHACSPIGIIESTVANYEAGTL